MDIGYSAYNHESIVDNDVEMDDRADREHESKAPKSVAEAKDKPARPTLHSLPSHTVAAGRGSLQEYMHNAGAFRLHETSFVMRCYDHTKHQIIDGYEIVLAEPRLDRKWNWSCGCPKYGLNDSCYHTLTAAVRCKATTWSADPSQPIIQLGRAMVWAVLGGEGDYRAIVQLKDGKVCLMDSRMLTLWPSYSVAPCTASGCQDVLSTANMF